MGRIEFVIRYLHVCVWVSELVSECGVAAAATEKRERHVQSVSSCAPVQFIVWYNISESHCATFLFSTFFRFCSTGTLRSVRGVSKAFVDGKYAIFTKVILSLCLLFLRLSLVL